MKTRKQEYGNANMVGRNIEFLRKKRGIKQKDFVAKLQVEGCDINPTSYSKLEGQVRHRPGGFSDCQNPRRADGSALPRGGQRPEIGKEKSLLHKQQTGGVMDFSLRCSVRKSVFFSLPHIYAVSLYHCSIRFPLAVPANIRFQSTLSGRFGVLR